MADIPALLPFDVLPFMPSFGIEITDGEKLNSASRKLGPFVDAAGKQLTEFACNMDLSDQPDAKDLGYVFTDTLQLSADPDRLIDIYRERLSDTGWLIVAIPDPEYSPKLGHFGCPGEWKSEPKRKGIFIGRFRRGPFVFILWADQKVHTLATRKYFHTTSDEYVAVCRLGAFGDHLMASSTLPGLKAKYPGKRLVYICDKNGEEALRHNPYVDEFITFPAGVISVNNMWPLADWLNLRFPLNVNLNYEAETRLLFPPQCISHKHSKSLRNKLADHNYVEWLHGIAEIDSPPEVKFYATDGELREAYGVVGDKPGPVIGIVIHGSSVNKFWPHAPALVTRLLHRLPSSRFVLLGEGKQAIEAGSHLLEVVGRYHGLDGRVLNLAGKTTIREAMTLVQKCDIVLGPETALTNAVSFEPDVFKVVLLSHSTVKNLTRDWPNTVSFAAIGLDCYPCNRLHFSFEFCRKSEKGEWAVCAEMINPAAVEKAILQYWDIHTSSLTSDSDPATISRSATSEQSTIDESHSIIHMEKQARPRRRRGTGTSPGAKRPRRDVQNLRGGTEEA